MCNSHKLNDKRRVRSGFCFCFCHASEALRRWTASVGLTMKSNGKSRAVCTRLYLSQNKDGKREGRLTESFMFVAKRTMMNLIALYYQTQTLPHIDRQTHTHTHTEQTWLPSSSSITLSIDAHSLKQIKLPCKGEHVELPSSHLAAT